MENKIIDKVYNSELMNIKQKINETRRKIAYTVNNELILLYYEIGGYINSHKSWGNKYVKRLSEDLKDYKGMSYTNLKYMSQLNSHFGQKEISQQLAGQIPWFTLVTIMSKCINKESRLWYIQKTHENGWSRSNLLKQIEAKAYERNRIEPVVSKGIKDYNNPLIKEILKDSYILDIMDKEFNNEKELKDKFILEIEKFLSELGKGFCLAGREYKLKYKSKTYYLDLLFYNYLLHAFIVVEVKIGKFKSQDFGQLVFYVNAVDEVMKGKEDNKTIGILLCKELDRTIVKSTIEKELTPISLSTYILQENLEKYFKNK